VGVRRDLSRKSEAGKTDAMANSLAVAVLKDIEEQVGRRDAGSSDTPRPHSSDTPHPLRRS